VRRTIGNLSVARVRTAVPKVGRRALVLPDGGNLYLQVTRGNSGLRRSWTFRYEFDGRRYEMGLGALHTLSLTEARDKARTLRQQLLEDVNPLHARQEARAARRVEAAKAVTFRQCAEQYIAAHEAGWRNARHAAQWPNTLAAYVYPIIGPLPVQAVDTGLVLKCIEPIWTTRPETASRVRGRIEAVLGWATARGYRTGDNPAAWRSHMENLLPARAKVRAIEHHPALPYVEMPAFMVDLLACDSIAARALEFLILTAARSGEVLGAQWNEVDLNNRTWTVPAARTKAHREHRVPLSDRAAEILSKLPRAGARVFPVPRTAMIDLLQTLRPITVHGFRSTFRDWAGDRTAFARDVVEAALAHAVGNRTEAAYRRSDALEKRHQLMAAWATFCATTVTGDVVSIGRGR
jgi:integrase